MTKIKIDIKTCKDCPHFKEGDTFSSDGWDRMTDWVCTKTEPHKNIANGVEWHEEKKIKVPEWCPVRVD